MDALEQSEALKLEADRLLANTGLLDVLGRYGKVHPVGSYHCNLMTRRSIDLCLVARGPQPDAILELAEEIAATLPVGSVYYCKGVVAEGVRIPGVMSLCVSFSTAKDTRWEVRILVSGHKGVEEALSEEASLLQRLRRDSREAIVQIKAELRRMLRRQVRLRCRAGARRADSGGLGCMVCRTGLKPSSAGKINDRSPGVAGLAAGGKLGPRQLPRRRRGGHEYGQRSQENP